MKLKALIALSVATLLAAAAAGQMPEGYQEVLVVKVKPEKRAEFDAISKKVAEANRKNKGDTWVASDRTFGEGDVVSFVSARPNYGASEKASEAFMAAMNKAYGQAGTQKMFQDFGNCLLSSSSEFRRRRNDLNYNPPADAAAFAKMVGESRWVRTIIVHVRPGQLLNFEARIKDLNAARQKANLSHTVLVSQGDSGQQGTVFYISRLMKSLGEIDDTPPLSKVLGEEEYQKFLRGAADTTEGTETIVSHFLPELSNPPEEIASASPDFWRPKPAPVSAAKPKPKAAEAEKPKGADK